MKTLIGLVTTNTVTRNNIVIPIKVLFSYLDQTAKTGLPMFLSHDMHQPVGWSTTIGMLITPALAGIVGATHLAETAEEMGSVARAANAFLSSKYFQISESECERLRVAIGGALDRGTLIQRREAVCAIEDGLAARLFPALFSAEEDKHSLTDLAPLKAVAPGVYEKEGLLLFAHGYFRRSMSRLNNLNGDFLGLLKTCADREGIQVKVALDPDMVGLPGTWHEPLELQYWWGPKFNDKLPTIADEVTRHEANQTLRRYFGILRMEFWWHQQNNIKTLEAEEVLENPAWGISSTDYGCRYVHSMLDPKSGTPIHLDGAIRAYNTDMLLQRLEENIKTAGRKSRYTKLWRIDGDLDVPLWKSLISHFYRDNRLVGEYFEGKDTVLVGESAVHSEPRPLENYLPRFVSPAEGVLVMVSYDKAEGTQRSGVFVESTHTIVKGDITERYIEFGAVDLLKLLQRIHGAVDLPAQHAWYAFEDLDMNLPAVSHAGPLAHEKAYKSLQVHMTFAAAVSAPPASRFITAELLIYYGTRRVKIGFAGFGEQLGKLLSTIEPFPAEFENLPDWCERTYQHSRDTFPSASYSSEHIDLVTASGSFFFRRKFADANVVGEANGRIRISVASDSEAARATREGRLALAPLYELRGVTCEGCNANYFNCPCVSLVEAKTSVKVSDCELLGYVWTERPAETGSSL